MREAGLIVRQSECSLFDGTGPRRAVARRLQAKEAIACWCRLRKARQTPDWLRIVTLPHHLPVGIH
jgi:hypothetical protein